MVGRCLGRVGYAVSALAASCSASVFAVSLFRLFVRDPIGDGGSRAKGSRR